VPGPGHILWRTASPRRGAQVRWTVVRGSGFTDDETAFSCAPQGATRPTAWVGPAGGKDKDEE